MTSPPLATIDIGNSRIKVGVFADANPQVDLEVPIEFFAWAHDEEPRWPQVTPASVRVGSVVPPALDTLKASMPTSWPTPTVVSTSDFGLTLDVDHPQQIGVDRVANAAAVAARFAGSPIVVVDAGTAITIDVIDSAGVFRGGAIAPGLQLCADSLTKRTAQLPAIHMAEAAHIDVPGRNTVEAITAGVQSVSRLGVAETVSKLVERLKEPSKLVFTGGDAEFFAAAHEEAIVIPGLTLLGLALAEPSS